MPIYEFLERVNVYYSVQADNEEDAYKELDKLQVSYDAIREKGSVDIIDCFINYVESENGNS